MNKQIKDFIFKGHSLTDTQHTVLGMRLVNKMTYLEIGKELSYTAEKVRQLEEQALNSIHFTGE